MATTPQIILNNVSFHLDQTPVRFSGVNSTFESLKYGIVGRNGVGKTTFLKLILGRLLPDSGTVLSSGHIIDSPQSHTSIDRFATIAEVLEVASILQAIKRINNASVS